MCVPQMDDYAEHAADDRVALANLALGLTVLECIAGGLSRTQRQFGFPYSGAPFLPLHPFDDLARQPG